MEEVIDVYQRPYESEFPVICLDEATKQMVKETVMPIAPQPGVPERVDYEYERNGTANLFMLCEPMAGWRHIEVTQQRTAIDYAHLLKALVDDFYPQASHDYRGAGQSQYSFPCLPLQSIRARRS